MLNSEQVLFKLGASKMKFVVNKLSANLCGAWACAGDNVVVTSNSKLLADCEIDMRLVFLFGTAYHTAAA